VVSFPKSMLGWPEIGPESDLGPSLALLVSKNPRLKSLQLGRNIHSGLSLSLSCLRDLENLSMSYLFDLEVDSIQVRPS
jgi:hypothetical protein